MFRKILVATDGRAGALGALRTAGWLAERDGAHVEVISVYQPMTLYGVGTLDIAAGTPAPLTHARMDSIRADVQQQLAEIGGEAPRWHVQVEVGPPTPTIARRAAWCHSDVILLGLAQGSGLWHWQSRETVAKLVHLASIPVLAVPPGVTSLPRTGVVAIDFSDFSIRAAREAARELGSDGTIHLAHVVPPLQREPGSQPTGGWGEYMASVKERLATMARELGPLCADAETHVLIGDPAVEVLRLGSRVGADLIATGSHGSGFFGRLLLGSVAGGLIHRASCSVLTVPPSRVPDELRIELTEAELIQGLGRAGNLLQPV
jgi:nucleotide-binding universal stress UspA family protein